MQDTKNKIEAILFVTGRFMDVEEIARHASIGSIGHVKEVLQELIKDYAHKEGALIIHEDQGKFKLGIKKEYNYLTTGLLQESELDEPTMRTLALIAYKQPVLQADIIDMRGTNAYDHIHILKEHQLITSERKGRTRALKLAPKFYDYFDIVESELKKNIETESIQKITSDTEQLEQEVEVLEKALQEKQKEHQQSEEKKDE